MEGFISQFAQGGRLIFPDSAYTISCGVQLINFVTDIIILCCVFKLCFVFNSPFHSLSC
jgi:hypothetical protein